MGWRELELVGSILEQRELGDSRLRWRELVISRDLDELLCRRGLSFFRLGWREIDGSNF